MLIQRSCKTGGANVRKGGGKCSQKVLKEAEHATVWIFKSVSHKELFRWILTLQSLGLWKSWAFTVLSVVKVVGIYAMSQDALSAEKSNHRPFKFLKLGGNVDLNTSVRPLPIHKAKLTPHQQAVKINPLSSPFMKCLDSFVINDIEEATRKWIIPTSEQSLSSVLKRGDLGLHVDHRC